MTSDEIRKQIEAVGDTEVVCDPCQSLVWVPGRGSIPPSVTEDQITTVVDNILRGSEKVRAASREAIIQKAREDAVSRQFRESTIPTGRCGCRADSHLGGVRD